MEKTKIGDVLLISSAMLFILGAIGLMAGYLPKNLIPATTTLALILLGAGVGLKKTVKK